MPSSAFATHISTEHFCYENAVRRSSLDVITVYEWKTLKQIYLESLAKLVQKIYYQTVPTTMTDLLVKRSLGYNLREKNCLSLPRVRTEMMKKSFCYKGSVLWNNFKNETREIENSSLFSIETLSIYSQYR